MAEASRARVTITLGRSGQVVKRAASVSDVDFSDSLPVAGNKRSVRDRLGSALDSSQINRKRLRGDRYISSLGANGVDDVQIVENDLRFKLMQKNVVRRSQSEDDQKFIDLREKLSRTGHPLHCSLDTRQHMPRSKETSILGRIPVSRRIDALPQMNSSRSSYAAWTLDHLRRRSPESIVSSSRGLSPPRNVEDLQRRPLSRTFDDVRAVPYMSKNAHNAPGPVSTSSYITKPTLTTGSVKPVPPGPPYLGQPPPPTGILQKSSYRIEEPQTVDGLLQSLGLGKYVILFKAEEYFMAFVSDMHGMLHATNTAVNMNFEVDMTALKQMGEHDLKELGIPMGPRKKILLALLPRSKQQS